MDGMPNTINDLYGYAYSADLGYRFLDERYFNLVRDGLDQRSRRLRVSGQKSS